MARNNIFRKPVHLILTSILGLIGIIYVGWLVFGTHGPEIPFSRVKIQHTLVNFESWCPNGDGVALKAYQLQPFDLPGKIAAENRRKHKWFSGPIKDERLLDELKLIDGMSFYKDPDTQRKFDTAIDDMPWESLVNSSSAYFYYERVDYWHGSIDNMVLWIIDTKTHRLYKIVSYS